MKITVPFLFIFLFPFSILACTCFPAGEIDIAQYNLTNLVFVGEAIDISIDQQNQRKEITFKITNNIKAPGKGKTVKIVTALHTATCGLPVEQGQKWYIWATKSSDGIYRSNICTRSLKLLPGQEDPSSGSIYSQDLAFIKSLKKKRGMSTHTYNNGKAVGKLKCGKPVGTWEYFDADDKFTQSCTYSNKGMEILCEGPRN